MANVENRAAEHGSIIITDTDTHRFGSGRLPCAARVLEACTIETITSPNCTNIGGFYDGASLDTDSPIILASISSIKLSSAGAIQLVYS